MSNELKRKGLEIKKSFFDYWDHVPNFIDMTEDQSKLLDQEVRSSIIDILALGIDDVDPATDEPRRRRVLNASELLDRINERLGEEIKKSNLYFHLEKLEDANLVRMVDQIPQGKRYTTYYGRTAKAFTQPHTASHKDKFGDLFDILPDLIKEIDPKLSETEVKESLHNAFDNYFRKCSDDVLSKWLDKHQDKALHLEIDLRRLYDLFDLLSRYDDATIAAMRKFSKLLDFETE